MSIKDDIKRTLDEANPDVSQLVEAMHEELGYLLEDSANWIDNGIAVIPYENFDYSDPEQLEAIREWEQEFISKALRKFAEDVSKWTIK